MTKNVGPIAQGPYPNRQVSKYLRPEPALRRRDCPKTNPFKTNMVYYLDPNSKLCPLDPIPSLLTQMLGLMHYIYTLVHILYVIPKTLQEHAHKKSSQTMPYIHFNMSWFLTSAYFLLSNTLDHSKLCMVCIFYA